MKGALAGAALLAMTLNTPARAQGLVARETADVGAKGAYSIGVFGPLTYAVSDTVELRAHPLLFLIAPNAVARVAHVRGGGVRVTGEYGLSVPTLAMRLSQGTLFPSWDRGGGRIGWTLVPRVGLVATRGARESRVTTFRTDLALGLPLTHSDATPLGAPAPLDLLFAPMLSGYRFRVGGLYDAPLGRRFRVRAYGDVYFYGRGKGFASPQGLANLIFRAGLGLDLGVGRMSRLTFGAAWWNSDQHAIDPHTFERKRSNDFLPTLDFIWAG